MLHMSTKHRVALYPRAVQVQAHGLKASPKGDAPRGEVRRFSEASRRRMQRMLAMTSATPRYLLTLTYPDAWPSARQAKAHLKTFCQRLERVAEAAGRRLAVVWRLEFQQRGAPHFHLLIFAPDGLPAPALVRAAKWGKEGSAEDFAAGRRQADWLQGAALNEWRALLLWGSVTWHAIVKGWFRKAALLSNSLDAHLKVGTDLKAIRNARMAVAYVSKYVAKADASDVPEGLTEAPGRFWGVRDRSDLLAPEVLAFLEFDDVHEADVWLEKAMGDTGNQYIEHCVREGFLSWFGFIHEERIPVVLEHMADGSAQARRWFGASAIRAWESRGMDV